MARSVDHFMLEVLPDNINDRYFFFSFQGKLLGDWRHDTDWKLTSAKKKKKSILYIKLDI